MTTVVEIPGTGEVEFPDSMSQAEIAAQVQRLNGANTPSPSPQTTPTEQSPSTVAGQPRITAEQALGQEATFRFLNNVIGVGDLAITSLANFESPFRGNPVGERPATLFEDITGQVPPEIGDSILPSGEDITAGLGATRRQGRSRDQLGPPERARGGSADTSTVHRSRCRAVRSCRRGIHQLPVRLAARVPGVPRQCAG